MFQPFSYALLFLAIVACNHKWGKPYDEARTHKEERHARRKARYEKNRAQEKKEFEEAQEKRREKREARKKQEERLEGWLSLSRLSREVAMAPNAKTVARQKRRDKEAKVKKKISKNTARIKRQKERAAAAGLPKGTRLRQPPPKRKADDNTILSIKSDLNYSTADALKAALRPQPQKASLGISGILTEPNADIVAEVGDELELEPGEQQKRKRLDSVSADERYAAKKAKHENTDWSFDSLLTEAHNDKKRKAPDPDHEDHHEARKRGRGESREVSPAIEMAAVTETACTRSPKIDISEHVAAADNNVPLPDARRKRDGATKTNPAMRGRTGKMRRATNSGTVRNPDEIGLRSSRRSYAHGRFTGKRGVSKMPADVSELGELWMVSDDDHA
ncbi:hypothetical protein LTR36_008162 [Oleoguttula mirabilis]|uniref:Uncharacterized protein n=1 Tax=Oleoguttula mirabilis TaxID=1507867 RepID=A0AAV9J8J1_9PEZI|nr:hypothetical protein LTR36_008162 [Oleoguttula mirabilis]